MDLVICDFLFDGYENDAVHDTGGIDNQDKESRIFLTEWSACPVTLLSMSDDGSPYKSWTLVR